MVEQELKPETKISHSIVTPVEPVIVTTINDYEGEKLEELSLK